MLRQRAQRPEGLSGPRVLVDGLLPMAKVLRVLRLPRVLVCMLYAFRVTPGAGQAGRAGYWTSPPDSLLVVTELRLVPVTR
jgi:hypothetical protein